MNTWILSLNPLAAAWLAALWRACWQGGLALLLVWAVCRAFHRLPARAKSWLWRLAYVKLLVAFFCAAPIALPLLPAAARRTASDVGRTATSVPLENLPPAAALPVESAAAATRTDRLLTSAATDLPLQTDPPPGSRPNAAS